jgi:hypothetical protein
MHGSQEAAVSAEIVAVMGGTKIAHLTAFTSHVRLGAPSRRRQVRRDQGERKRWTWLPICSKRPRGRAGSASRSLASGWSLCSFESAIGDGYKAAVVNYGFPANAVPTTDDAVTVLR